MNIAVNTLSIRPGKVGGGETFLFNLLKGFQPHLLKDRLYLIVSPDNRTAFDWKLPGYELVTAKVHSASRYRRVLFERTRMSGLLKRIGADVVFCPGNTGIPRPPCPMVVVVQSLLTHLLPDEAGRLRSYYFRKTLRRSVQEAQALIAVSHDIADELARIDPAAKGKTRVIHEGMDREFTRMTDPQQIDRILNIHQVKKPYLLFVSSLKPYKNPDKAIVALAEANRHLDPRRTLVIVGRDLGGMQPELKALADSLGVGQEVIFTGAVKRDELPAFYSAADVFLFPSVLESFGIPPLEAFTCRTPVISSSLSAVGEVVGDGGVQVDPDDTSTFGREIVRLINDPDHRSEMIARGQNRLADFDWDVAAAQTLETLREAAGD